METFSLSPPLIKAARALLEWQQADLANASDLSLTAINNYERKVGVTRNSTLVAIKNALENNGIEFMPNGGIRRVSEIATVTRFTGNDFAATWTYEIVATVRHSGEVLTSSSDENLWSQPAIRQSNEDYLKWGNRMNIKLRSLIAEGQKIPTSLPKNYRAIPAEMIGKITYCLYADRLAFVLWKKKQVIVLRNTSVVETFRNQFNYLWKIGKPV